MIDCTVEPMLLQLLLVVCKTTSSLRPTAVAAAAAASRRTVFVSLMSDRANDSACLAAAWCK